MHVTLKNGKRMYYEVHGEGKPLVILNGIMMSTVSWKAFVEPLSADNQLILIDFLDQGQSDKMEEAYDHDVQLAALSELLEELLDEPFNLFGISYGGEVALQYSLNNQKKIEKLLLFNTCMETSYWLQEIGNAWNKAAHDPEAYYLTTIPYIYSPLFFNNNREWMESRKKKLLEIFSNQSFIDSMKRLTDSSSGYDISDRVNEIKIPTLIVGSEYDFVTPFYQQKNLNNAIASSELVFVPESGHAIMYEKPRLFISLIKGFISTNQTEFTI